MVKALYRQQQNHQSHRKMMNNNQRHVFDRSKERAGFGLDVEAQKTIVKKIHDMDSIHIARSGGKWCRCHIHDVEYNAMTFRVVYDKKYKIIRTVLFPDDSELILRRRPQWRNKWQKVRELWT